MILVEICVHDEFLKEELYGVISMTTTYIEKRENELKHRAEVAERDALDAKRKVLEANELLKEISDNIDDGGNLNQTTIKKLLSVTNKL